MGDGGTGPGSGVGSRAAGSCRSSSSARWEPPLTWAARNSGSARYDPRYLQAPKGRGALRVDLAATERDMEQERTASHIADRPSWIRRRTLHSWLHLARSDAAGA